MPVFLTVNLVAGVWVLGIAVGLGFPIATRFVPRATEAIQLALGFLVGATLLSHAVMAAALLGWLTPPPLLTILAVLSIPLVVGRKRIWRHLHALVNSLRSAFLQASRVDRGILIAVLVTTALSLVIPLLPVTNADALGYSTAAPARFVADGRMQFYPESVDGSAWVLVIETVHMLGYGLGLRPLGVWLEVAAQFLLLFAIADAYAVFTGNSDDRVSGFVAAAVLLLVPLTQMMPFMTKGHMTELLALIVCFTLVLEAPEKGGWLGIAASAAVAMAVKYSAVVGLLALVIPAFALGLRRPARSLRWQDVLGMLAVGVVISCPAYLRNLAWTGNPFYPIEIPPFSSPYHLHAHEAWVRSVRTDAGYGLNLKDLALWWLRAATVPASGLSSYMGPFFLIFLPLSLILSPRPRHLWAAIFGFVSASVVLFFSTGQFERYFLAAIIPMALLAIAGWRGLRGRRRVVFAAGYLLIGGIAGGLTFPLKAYGVARQAPALLSTEEVTRVLTQNTPFYEDFIRIREVIPVSEPIVCMIRACQYLPNYRREDLIFRVIEQQSGARGPDPRRVWAELRSQGLWHILLGAPETIAGNPARPATVWGWLARCGGQVTYRNRQARMAVRDPRNTRTGDLIVITLSDSLAESASRLEGSCALDEQAWPR